MDNIETPTFVYFYDCYIRYWEEDYIAAISDYLTEENSNMVMKLMDDVKKLCSTSTIDVQSNLKKIYGINLNIKAIDKLLKYISSELGVKN